MNPVKPTKEFVANFEAACLRYGCTEAEKEEMKVCARGKLGEALVCFAALAREVAGPEADINARIKDSIKTEKENQDEVCH